MAKHFSKVLMVENQEARALLLEQMFGQVTTLLACIATLGESNVFCKSVEIGLRKVRADCFIKLVALKPSFMAGKN